MHKKILSSASYLAGASLIEKIGAFIIIPILTSALTTENYGSLMLAFSYVSLIMLFIYNGLHSALFRWYGMWEESFSKQIYEKYIFYIVNAIGIAVIFILFFIHMELYNLDKFLKIDFSLFVATLISSLIMVSYSLKSSIWIIENKAYKNFIFMFLKTIFLVLSIYLFIDQYPYAITKLIAEIIIGSILSSYLIYIYLVKYPSINSVEFKEIKPVLKESLVYGWGLQISQIAFWVITSSDRIMIANFTNNKLVAYYSILMIGITIMFVVIAFNNSFSVYYNKMLHEKLSMKKINNYIFIYLLYGFLAIVLYKLFLYYFADTIVLLLSTKEYLGVSKYMYLTSDIILFYFIYLLFSRYLHAFKMVKIVMYITIFSALLNIILNYILIQEYDILGALIGSILAYLSMGVLAFLLMFKKIKFIYMKKLMILFVSVIIINFSLDILLYKGGI